MRCSAGQSVSRAARWTASTAPRTSASSGAASTAASKRARISASITSACSRLVAAVPRVSARAGEVDALLRGAQRHAPRVLDPGEELLAEGEVAVRRLVTLGAGVRPRAGDRADDGGDARGAGVDEGALEDDVGVVARREH